MLFSTIADRISNKYVLNNGGADMKHVIYVLVNLTFNQLITSKLISQLFFTELLLGTKTCHTTYTLTCSEIANFATARTWNYGGNFVQNINVKEEEFSNDC